MNRLVLIDGNAILHRAYHALPPLTSPDGTIVNAVYGFVSMLIKLFQELRPTHMAVAFDRAAPTFRKTLYKEYQASRPKMEDALVGQIGYVHDVAAAFGIPNFELDGYEADDVIGTIVHKELPMDEMIIVTGDKDLLQLVDDVRCIRAYMPTKGLSEGKLFGEKEVVEKMGVPPKQIPDLKALMGDSSDNYPGVAGIGPKTAVGLITSYGSIEKLYDEVKGKKQSLKKKGKAGEGETLFIGAREKLLNGQEMARMSKDLATIRTDVPIAFTTDSARVASLDTPEARAKLEELHFPSLIKRLGKSTSDASTTKTRPRFSCQSKKEKKKLASEQQELF